MIDPAVLRSLLAFELRSDDSPLSELTAREHEVLGAMATGKSNAAIAADLGLTKRAVEKHIRAIFLKLELGDELLVSRRVTAVLRYLSDGHHGVHNGAAHRPANDQSPSGR